ncbi:unnamed protein product [Rhizoctonia solani]|uniref:Protein kinase domain-containing protein n=1 Tax=Rhizoctonia solani TaxID=456999 RepID=A0A8H3BTB2_9AGAM|nr:unnamed protein product [Rhizoctonia solani]
MEQMTDTLRGLAYMHNSKSGPIAHGDIKLSNILVTANETALICDFGRSRQPLDEPGDVIVSNSSPFAGTVRYMSPELFVPDGARPTPVTDMWAYGCVSLEILCRIQPYHETTSDTVIAELIKSGHLLSDRPHGPRSSLINDKSWNVLSSCWQAQDWRPTAHVFLERLSGMLHSEEIPSSPILVDMFPRLVSGPIPPWPSELGDLNDLLGEKSQLYSSIRSTVWMTTLHDSQVNHIVVVKVPRLNASIQNQARHDHLRYVLRKVVAGRFGVRHQNIVNLLGIASGFSPHEGLVFEYCSHRNLVTYFKENWVRQTEYARPPAPEANAYSLMCDVLEELKYMHDYPVPIPQGDLTPDNILVGFDGRAKISLFSFGRVLASLPSAEAVTASIGSILAFRWMSPEIMKDNQQPTIESDMWTIGCIFHWRARSSSVRSNLSQKTELQLYASIWRRFRYEGKGLEEEVDLRMAMYRATYAHKWYSISAPVVIKIGYDFNDSDQQALVTSIQHGITIAAQIDHPHIQKLLGIDSSNTNMPDMVFEFCSEMTFDSLLDNDQASFHERFSIANIFVLSNGTAKLTNFTSSFQYTSGQPTSPAILSTMDSTPQRSPLYWDPCYLPQIDGVKPTLPTLAGDVWSTGMTILSSFSENFFRKSPDVHVSEISSGKLPYESDEALGLEENISTLLRSILVLEPVGRPSVWTVLSWVSKLL